MDFFYKYIFAQRFTELLLSFLMSYKTANMCLSGHILNFQLVYVHRFIEK
jgi:hypothetical protein